METRNRDNARAAALEVGLTIKDPSVGEITLDGPTGEVGIDGWDTYFVSHSGGQHVWSSSVVWRVFE